MKSVTIKTAAAAAIGIGMWSVPVPVGAHPKPVLNAASSASLPNVEADAFQRLSADSTGTFAAPCRSALPGADAGMSVTIWSESATVDDTVTLELRSSGSDGAGPEVPALMLSPELQSAVHAAVRSLRERLGLGYRFMVEEVVEPSDSDAEPILFLLVAVAMGDETGQRVVDEFITEEWAKQPVGVRALVRVGSEFI